MSVKLLPSSINLSEKSSIDPSATTVTPFLRVKQGGMEKFGICQGDYLLIDRAAPILNGALLVLEFNKRMVIRQLQIGPHHWQLSSLHGLTQAMEWPKHEPLPLVGVVRQIVRHLP